MKHYLTKYYENSKQFAESRLQINISGKCYCFSRRIIQVGGIKDMPVQINIDADRLVEEVRRELIKQQEQLERDPLDTFAPENQTDLRKEGNNV